MLSDKAVIDKVREGEQKAFSEIVRRHQVALLRMVFRMVQSQQLAEDIVQEAFLKAYRHLAHFEGRSSFKSWLFQIGLNCARNALRDKSRTHLDVDKVILGQQEQQEASLSSESLSSMLLAIVNALPPKQKLAVHLRIYEDMSFAEIAEIMQCPYDTAKANFRHGIMKLKLQLAEQRELMTWVPQETQVEFLGLLGREQDSI